MLRKKLRTLRKNAGPFLKLLASSSQRKHAFRWLDSFQDNYLLDTQTPWLTFDAIDYLVEHLPMGAKVFEYGSGASTLFWLKRGAECLSIEHDPEWYALIRRYLSGTSCLDYRLVLPDPPISSEGAADPADPSKYATLDDTLRRNTFQTYVTQIDNFPEGYFDAVLVDGRARPSCIMHSAPKVKAGGMLILDNSDRDYYLVKTRDYLRDFSEKQLSGAVPADALWSCTTIFIKAR